jgi:hypothetical protein
MKKLLLAFVLCVITVEVFAQFNSSYDISEVYVEMNLGYDTYYAEINDFITSKFGEVKSLYKKARLSDIGYGKYVVQIKHVTDDLYKIMGTSYVIQLRHASRFDFSGYDDYILDTTNFRGTVTKKDN